MNGESSIVLNKAQLFELIHQGVDLLARSSDHFGQQLLGYFRQSRGKVMAASKFVQLQEQARQPLLAGIEQMVDQILLGPDVSPQEIVPEMVGKRRVRVQRANHIFLADFQDAGRKNRGHRRRADR